ncbi:hypothetical protein M431DRAFT_373818 [Trichoderma harzianum CBS 226.95]|uniref:Uncharacterized protein n=1 Tax=Trichoderma harzianum CBS 226.95 TaxID=983964 RepID=A0A2T4AGY9_TRIHA|nr:hypothetical protein M431DRAFT_373818 [Trichoderma harzianum CBS 226.95]PTB56355.1 hypothetical protein M431DRAFT_373818 [Trichoderma harzianum CBS 226.95]
MVASANKYRVRHLCSHTLGSNSGFLLLLCFFLGATTKLPTRSITCNPFFFRDLHARKMLWGMRKFSSTVGPLALTPY